MSFKSTHPGVEDIKIETAAGLGNSDVEKHTHPAFGQLTINRTSGRMALYGSDFLHQHYITLRIAHSERRRHLSSDWHHTGKEIIEIAMSEAQWATFVSSIGLAAGVPCTLRYLEGRQVPMLPNPASRAKQFGGEMKESVQESIERLNDLLAKIDSMGLSKKKADELRLDLRVARDNLAANIAFVAERFDEHMEETVEQGKMELNGYLTGVTQAAGLQALSTNSPIALPSPEDA